MATTAISPSGMPWRDLLRRRWFLLFAIALTAVPTVVRVAEVAWTTEAGMAGALVMATALWLFWRRWDDWQAMARPGSIVLATAAVVLGAVLYVFGRAFGFLSIEVGALILMLLAAAYAHFGARALALTWFPILYLFFVVPMPGWIVDALTGPLKMFVSQATTWLLGSLGYPIARLGVTLYIDQYQLLVEDACAGLNSLSSLIAMGLFYIYLLHDASWRYALLLVALLVPIAILANIIRVIILVMITFYLGDDAAQGYLHGTAGIFTFIMALLLTFGVDSLLTPVRRWLTPAAAVGGGIDTTPPSRLAAR